jgi:hypothetical protein
MDRNAKIARLREIIPKGREKQIEKYLKAPYVMNVLVTMPEKDYFKMLRNYRGVEPLWQEINAIVEEEANNNNGNHNGGKRARKTHRRKSHKRRTHKRRTHRRRN